MLRDLTASDARPGTPAEEVLSCIAFDTTGSLKVTETRLGQGRAEQAVAFGARVRARGFHVFAMGPGGIDKRQVVTDLLRPVAAGGQEPDDWLYVQGFADSRRPRALRLQAGQGQRLHRDLAALVQELQELAARMVDDSDLQRRLRETSKAFEQTQQQNLEVVRAEAAEAGLKLLQTPQGFALAPVREGKVLEPDAFGALSEAEQSAVQADIERLSQILSERLQDLPSRQRDLMRRQRTLIEEHLARVVHAALGRLRNRYQAWPEVMLHLNRLRDDVVDHAQAILAMHEEPGSTLAPKSAAGVAWQRFWDRYRGNLLVDNGSASGAPVVHEANPGVEQLIGRQEHRPEMGNLVTDFTLIRAGALHRANGGYLLLDAERLLGHPWAWEVLKRALQEREIRLESTARLLGAGDVVSLEPEAIPLQVKVVLLGERRTWHLLSAQDPEFQTLFRVVADFADHVPADNAHLCAYVNLLAALASELGTRPLDPAGVAAMVDHGRRLAGDRERLTTVTAPLSDLLVEADDIAAGAALDTIGATQVHGALEQLTRRLDRIRDDVHARILDGTVHVATDGRAVGEVNGLAVLQVGQFAFGQPSRISATARLGRGGVLDIEREAEMGGNLHSKAVLIVQSFIAARYAREHPLALSASLVFEQNYGGVDGDSASVAEVCALLSAIARLPLRQDIALTGSMDQHGRVQAIGGANEKIEGFFDICRTRGLNGQQGCLVPASNLRHLMVRPDVAAAIERGEFHLWTMEHIDDALGLLTGLEAGAADADGVFAEGTANACVAAAVARFAGLAEARDRARLEPLS